MGFSVQIMIVLGALCLTLLVAALPRAAVIATTRDGAVAAIAHVQEWSKWIAGIQTAAIAGLALVVFKKDTVLVQPLPGHALLFALAGFVFLGAGLFCSAWVLASLPSLAIRIHARVTASAVIAPGFDIYDQPLFGWASRPHLGYMLTVTHWLWAVGLVAVGLFFVTLLSNGAACA